MLVSGWEKPILGRWQNGTCLVKRVLLSALDMHAYGQHTRFLQLAAYLDLP